MHPSWIEVNEVPRRLIIHFFHEFTDEEIKELNNDITITPGYEVIFMKGDSKKQLRSNHQKGHVNKEGVYIKHTELIGKKKGKQNLRGEKPQGKRNPDFNPNARGPNRFTKPMDFALGALPVKGGAPKLAPNFNAGQFGRPPPIGHSGPMGIPSLAPPFQGNRPQPPSFNPQPFVGSIPPPPQPYSLNKTPFLPPGPTHTGTMPPAMGLLGKGMPPISGQFGAPQFPFKHPVMPPTSSQPPAKE